MPYEFLYYKGLIRGLLYTIVQLNGLTFPFVQRWFQRQCSSRKGGSSYTLSDVPYSGSIPFTCGRRCGQSHFSSELIQSMFQVPR